MAVKRPDGRKFDELRPIEAKVGVIPNADGSAMFQAGNTRAVVAVYGPRNLVPRFLQDPLKGVLRCHYNMMPFSSAGDRIRPGQNRRAKEISMVTQKSLLPVLDLSDFPNSGVDVFIELPQTDAGTRCAGIVAASMALADAGIPMRDLVSSVAVGLLDEDVVLDVNYAEEEYGGGAPDIAMASIPQTEELTLLQMDGDVSPAKLKEAIQLGLKGMKQINEIQRKALKDKYKSAE